jgi:hypothetical protein
MDPVDVMLGWLGWCCGLMESVERCSASPGGWLLLLARCDGAIAGCITRLG